MFSPKNAVLFQLSLWERCVFQQNSCKLEPKDDIGVAKPDANVAAVRRQSIMLLSMSMIQNFRRMKSINLFRTHLEIKLKKGLKN